MTVCVGIKIVINTRQEACWALSVNSAIFANLNKDIHGVSSYT